MSVTQNPVYQTFKYPAPVDPSQVATLQASVIDATGATLTLTAAQSGSLVFLDRAAGVTVTLPAPSVGLEFDIFVKTTVTSNNHKIITDAGTTLLVGTILVTKAADGTNLATFGNGSTHIAVTMNGTTTGGVAGTWLRFSCIASTLWAVEGFDQASGTIATPFATS